MKTTKLLSTLASLFLASSIHSLAIVGLGIEKQCTNIVISWPSMGNEHYLIQFRPTLDPSTPWENLTNNYPANSTNRTTYTIFGVGEPCSSGGGGVGGGSNPPSPLTLSGSWSGPMLVPQDSSKVPVPLGLYPPGIDLTGYTIIWPNHSTDEWSEDLVAKWRVYQQEEQDEPQTENGGGGGSSFDSGFYRVFLVPDFMFDYSSYEFTDGVEFLPINLGAAPNLVTKIEMFVDGKVFRHTQPAVVNLNFGTPSKPDFRPTFGLWFFSDRLTNGTHQLQLLTTLQLNKKLNFNTPHLTLTNHAMTTSISNPIVFQPWKTLMVGTDHTFNAKTTIVPSDWYIDVYDAWGFWVTGTNGTTTDGNISWTWDFYDDNSNLRDAAEYDPFFDPYVTVIGTGNASAQNGPQEADAPIQRPAPLSSHDYPTSGGWIIAYQDNAKHLLAARDALNQAFSGLGGGPTSAGLPTTTIFLKYGNTNDVGMSADPVQNMMDRNASWDSLRNALQHPAYRNLFIFAHGSSNSIGGDWESFIPGPNGPQPDGSEYDPNEYMVGTNKIVSTTRLTSGWCYRLHHLVDGPHPYRFVFLDGCASATGDWPYPFGMIPQTNSLSYYQADGERPDAFVGWNQTIIYTDRIGQSVNGFGDYQKFANFRTQWMTLWRYPGPTNTEELWRALDRAAQSSGWVTPQKLGEIICIFGFNNLKFNEYNQNNFTFPP